MSLCDVSDRKRERQFGGAKERAMDALLSLICLGRGGGTACCLQSVVDTEVLSEDRPFPGMYVVCASSACDIRDETRRRYGGGGTKRQKIDGLSREWSRESIGILDWLFIGSSRRALGFLSHSGKGHLSKKFFKMPSLPAPLSAQLRGEQCLHVASEPSPSLSYVRAATKPL